MKETGTFLERALLAGACALPLAAVLAVVVGDNDDSDPRLPCDGCGEWHYVEDLTSGDAGTRWCSGCREDTAPPAPAPGFDRIQEDDGEP